jgi:glutamine amidotransferase
MAILGTTDSEHIAALYFYHLGGDSGDWESLYPVSQMITAMQSTLAQLEQLKSDAEAKHGVKTEHNHLNLLVNSGSSLVAIRYATPLGDEPPSLYYSTKAGATLNRKFEGHPDKGGPVDGDKPEGPKKKEEHGKHVIVASEPSTFDQSEWEMIQPQTLIAVGEDCEVKFEQL